MRSRLIWLGVLGALATAAAPAAVAATEKRHIVRQQDSGTWITLARDELLVVELSARTSTGYSWQVEALDGAVLAAVNREHQSGPDLGGVDTERLLFTGVAAGTAKLSLVYRRPWVPAKAGDPRWAIDVDVAGAFSGAYAAPAPAPTLAYSAMGAYPAKYNVCDPGDGSYSKCTAPKDQGSNNACWSFATAGVFENILQLKNPSGKYDLSEQYLISCDVDGYSSTNGGYEAFNMYIDRFKSPQTAAGAVYESDFPYVGRDVSCAKAYPHHEKLKSFTSLGETTQATVDQIKAAIQAHGPVFTGVCADSSMQQYDGRSIFKSSCSQANHAVVLVGWDDNNGNGYWLMRNSWGATWGDRGHLKIAYGSARIGERTSWVAYESGPNVAPVASAGKDRTVKTGATVTLDGSASADSDGSISRFAWAQTGGTPTVTLSGASAATATFTAPSSAATLRFTLTVTDDGGLTGAATVTITVDPAATNAAPVAEAGPAQSVNAGDPVQLDGSGSSDPDGTVASHAWKQTAGSPTVTLTGGTTSKPSFTAPDVSAQTKLTFALTVKDDGGLSATDTVVVTVDPVANNVGGLVADAGSPQTVQPGAMVQLNGFNSQAPAGSFISDYQWTQTGGPQVELGGWGPMASFTAPASDATLTFKVTIKDIDGQSASDTTTITVGGGGTVDPGPPSASNTPPTAEAGPAQAVSPGATVRLDASASTDPDGSIASYAWTQTVGPSVTLTGATTATPTFVAPSVTASAALTFSVTVTDDAGATATDSVTVTVKGAGDNLPPVAHAGASRQVYVGARVELDGSASRDLDGAISAYAWHQTSASPVVTLTGASTAKATFTAPSSPGVLELELVVTDDKGATGRAPVTVTVVDRSGSTTSPTPNPAPDPPRSTGCSSSGPGLGLGSLSALAALLARPRRRLRPAPAPSSR